MEILRLRFLLLPAACGIFLLLAGTGSAQQKPSAAAPSDFSEEKQNEGMPEWTKDDQKAALQGKWWNQISLLLPGPPTSEEKAGEPPVPAATAVEKSPVDPFPENFSRVDEQFLPEYIRPIGVGLIDPQKLLTEIERDDVLVLISKLMDQFGIHAYVSIFAKDQAVPPEVNAPTLARQIFKPGERSMLLHVHLGDVKSMQVAMDQEMTDKLGDRGRRILLHRIKENASAYSDNMDQLMEALVAMAVYGQPDQQDAGAYGKTGVSVSSANIPVVNVDITEPEGVKKNSIGELVKHWEEKLAVYRNYLVIGLALFIFLGFVYFWRRSVRPVHLLPTEPDVRLGGPNGAGISRGINYGDREGTQPDSVSRRQMRDHMRDIS